MRLRTKRERYHCKHPRHWSSNYRKFLQQQAQKGSQILAIQETERDPFAFSELRRILLSTTIRRSGENIEILFLASAQPIKSSISYKRDNVRDNRAAGDVVFVGADIIAKLSAESSLDRAPAASCSSHCYHALFAIV